MVSMMAYLLCKLYATSDDIVDDTIEQQDLVNMGIAVGILLLCALELSRYAMSHK